MPFLRTSTTPFGTGLGLALLLASGAASAAPGKAGKTRGHKAHEHGAAKLNIAVDGKKARVEFESPAESIYGFEHEARTDAQKKTRDDAIEKLKNDFSGMVVLQGRSDCKWTPAKVESFVPEEKGDAHGHAHGHGQGGNAKASKAKAEATHGEVHASFDVECATPLAGTKVTFAFAKSFPKIKRVTVQALSGETQSGLDVAGDKGSVTL